MNFLTKLIKKKTKGKYVLSLDLGTRVAKALVSYVDYDKNKITNLGIGRAEQKTGNVVGGKISDVRGVIAVCKRAIDDSAQMANIRPEEVMMGFSGNTVKICTSSFEINRKNPGNRMDVYELKNIIKDVHQKSLQKIQDTLTYKEKQTGIKLVSSDIVNFSIDGYRIINPLNFRGRRIRITISNFYVLMSDFVIINSIAEELKLKLLKIAYGPYAVVKAIGVEDALNFSAVMIDVGGNITDVVLVKNGNIQKAGMFILGGHLFTKRLAHKFDISEKNAEELKINYSKGRLNESDRNKIEDILSEDVSLWFSGVQLILEESAKDFLIPSRILFYGGGSQLPGIVSSINNLVKSDISFSDKPNLDFIRSSFVSDNTDKTKKLNDFQDMTLVGLVHLCLDFVDMEDTANFFLAQII
jgi:cell division protein FtsA